MLDHLKQLCEAALAPALAEVAVQGAIEAAPDGAAANGCAGSGTGDGFGSGGDTADGVGSASSPTDSAARRFLADVLCVAERANAKQLAAAAMHAATLAAFSAKFEKALESLGGLTRV